MKIKFWKIILPVLIILAVSCVQNTDEPTVKNNQKSGNLTVKITDAPFPSDLVAEANIKFDMITLKKSGLSMNDDKMESDSTSMADTTAFIVLSETPDSVNLMELSNGVTKVLTENEIPVGEYNEIRLHIVNASVKLKDGRTFDLKIPSGNASGLKIKIKPSLQIMEGMYGQVLIDFDISRSFKAIGNEHSKKGIKGFHFSPVVRGVNLTLTSGISGIVSDTSDVNIQDALVQLFSGSDTITSALSGNDGYYAIIGIPVGTYSMECSHADYDTLRVDSVKVLDSEVTEQNFVLTPKAAEQ